MNSKAYNFIFAAGGTGGHLYPAVAVAEQLKLLMPNSNILFIGTKNKIEAKVIPLLGFNFKTIWISGLRRKLTIKNLLFPIKLIVGSIQSFIINFQFKPNVAIGAGAYVSGPVIMMSKLLGSKVVLLEQNSFPGVTNRMLEKKADQIHISFEDSKKYFKDQTKLILSGNPIRTTLQLKDKIESLNKLNLSENKKTLLVLGGSLGASTINFAIKENLPLLTKADIQIIWQTGELYFDQYKSLANEKIKIFPFISEIENAYSACDLIVARAGATTIAEIAYLGLPVLFIPSKNVAANHQYKNAKSLADENAALLIEDSKLNLKLGTLILKSIQDENLLRNLSKNILKFSKPDAAKIIAEEVIKLAGAEINIVRN
ncbi:MAG: undecaprenyldiphospho-muramoylpentapeptide beta-N-acetylglucosaminyltransferase [Ignavibacteriae bacterium]|nr:undecaprenyldiphospho-muramoylpentapeptide beta-N-acetylglucosaminyltransferase [Ignavibacteriota bacterium]